MNGGRFVPGEGRRVFFDIIKAKGGESALPKRRKKTSHYSHQFVGMRLLKHLSNKKRFGRETLEFCHSQTPLLFWDDNDHSRLQLPLWGGGRDEIPQDHFHEVRTLSFSVPCKRISTLSCLVFDIIRWGDLSLIIMKGFYGILCRIPVLLCPWPSLHVGGLGAVHFSQRLHFCNRTKLFCHIGGNYGKLHLSPPFSLPLVLSRQLFSSHFSQAGTNLGIHLFSSLEFS